MNSFLKIFLNAAWLSKGLYPGAPNDFTPRSHTGDCVWGAASVAAWEFDRSRLHGRPDVSIPA
jgi:hypothetical protein